MKPPIKGEVKGPMNTAMAKIVIAIPRSLLLYRSAKHAGTTARGLAEKRPLKNRESITVW